jgi:hypothetical protein
MKFKHLKGKHLIFSRRSCQICRQHLQKWRPVQLLASSPRMGRLAGRLILCLQSSARQFALISFSKDLLVSRSQSQADCGAGPSTLEWQRTSDSPMLSVRKQESRPRLNLGEQVRRAKNTKVCGAGTDILHRPCCCSYSSCLWWWYTSRWSSSFRQSMSIRSDVRTHKSLAQMAPEDQPWTKVRDILHEQVYAVLIMRQTLRYCIGHCCLFRSCSPPRPWSPHLPHSRSPSCRLFKSIRRCCSDQDICCCRPTQGCWCRARHRKGTKVTQATCRKGQDEGPKTPTTPWPTCRLQSRD